jgi:hypothetical protein
MLIFIKYLNGNTEHLEVEPADTIEVLKRKIEEISGMPAYEQILLV